MIEHVTRKLEPADEECVALRMYDPSALVYILVNAVKEQQRQINLLKEEYSIVKDLLKDRKSHSEALESRIQLLEQKVVDKKSSTANLSIEAPVEID